MSVSQGQNVPVQNGRVDSTVSGPITATATFQPDCTPPMTVSYSNVVVTDQTNGISKNALPG